MTVTKVGIEMEVREVQWSKAPELMAVTDVGMAMEGREMQEEKA